MNKKMAEAKKRIVADRESRKKREMCWERSRSTAGQLVAELTGDRDFMPDAKSVECFDFLSETAENLLLSGMKKCCVVAFLGGIVSATSSIRWNCFTQSLLVNIIKKIEN